MNKFLTTSLSSLFLFVSGACAPVSSTITLRPEDCNKLELWVSESVASRLPKFISYDRLSPGVFQFRLEKDEYREILHVFDGGVSEMGLLGRYESDLTVGGVDKFTLFGVGFKSKARLLGVVYIGEGVQMDWANVRSRYGQVCLFGDDAGPNGMPAKGRVFIGKNGVFSEKNSASE